MRCSFLLLECFLCKLSSGKAIYHELDLMQVAEGVLDAGQMLARGFWCANMPLEAAISTAANFMGSAWTACLSF
jgi:hypothetical protein